MLAGQDQFYTGQVKSSVYVPDMASESNKHVGPRHVTSLEMYLGQRSKVPSSRGLMMFLLFSDRVIMIP